MLKGYSLFATNGVSDTAALILERWQCVRRIRTLLGNLRHQRSTLREPIALRPCGEEFKPFFVQYRSSLNRADAACSNYMTVTILFCRGCAQSRYFPFSPNSCPSGYSRNDTKRVEPHLNDFRCDATLIYRTRLLHLCDPLRDRMQPSYCFHGTTVTRRCSSPLRTSSFRQTYPSHALTCVSD